MTDYLFRRWLLEDAIITRKTLAIGASWTKFFGRNPQRFALVFSSNPNFGVWYSFSEAPQTTLDANFEYAFSYTIPFMSFDHIGGMICESIWALANGAGGNLTMAEVSIEPSKHRQMKGMLHEFLSQYQSP